MRPPLASVAATAAEEAAPLAGDRLVPAADVVMDTAFDVAAPPEAVWPWIVQLGRKRAGWYLPRRVERVLPRTRRATRELVPRWQRLAVGDVVPDYGGGDASFEVVEIEPAGHLLYRSRRGHTDVSWVISLAARGAGTRVHLRLRLGPVRRVRLARSVGGLFDAVTIAGMAAGLRERLAEQHAA